MKICQLFFVMLCFLVTLSYRPTEASDKSNALWRQVKREMIRCCEQFNDDETTLDCTALMSAKETRLINYFGANPDMLVRFLFKCAGFGETIKKDNSECCQKANVSERCLSVCNPKNFDSNIGRLNAVREYKCAKRALLPALIGRNCGSHKGDLARLLDFSSIDGALSKVIELARKIARNLSEAGSIFGGSGKVGSGSSGKSGHAGGGFGNGRRTKPKGEGPREPQPKLPQPPQPKLPQPPQPKLPQPPQPKLPQPPQPEVPRQVQSPQPKMPKHAQPPHPEVPPSLESLRSKLSQFYRI